MRYTPTELIAVIEAAMESRCGTVPELASPVDGIPVFEWLLWCIEIMESGDADHRLDDAILRHLAHQFQRTETVQVALEAALDRHRIDDFLRNPAATIVERVLRG